MCEPSTFETKRAARSRFAYDLSAWVAPGGVCRSLRVCVESRKSWHREERTASGRRLCALSAPAQCVRALCHARGQSSSPYWHTGRLTRECERLRVSRASTNRAGKLVTDARAALARSTSGGAGQGELGDACTVREPAASQLTRSSWLAAAHAPDARPGELSQRGKQAQNGRRATTGAPRSTNSASFARL